MDQRLKEDVAGTAMQRANLYGLLATIFRSPMSNETLHALRSPSILDAFREAGADPGEDFAQAPADKLIHDLAVDYTQLFHGPRGHMPPYESVQCGTDGGSLAGPAAVRVRRFLEVRGFRFNEDIGELPDHIGVELEFMREMLSQESAARQDGDTAATLRCRESQAAFLEQHLGAWGPDLGKRIQDQAETPFYRAAGNLLTQFLEFEQAGFAAEPSRGLESDRTADTTEMRD